MKLGWRTAGCQRVSWHTDRYGPGQLLLCSSRSGDSGAPHESKGGSKKQGHGKERSEQGNRCSASEEHDEDEEEEEEEEEKDDETGSLRNALFHLRDKYSGRHDAVSLSLFLEELGEWEDEARQTESRILKQKRARRRSLPFSSFLFVKGGRKRKGRERQREREGGIKEKGVRRLRRERAAEVLAPLLSLFVSAASDEALSEFGEKFGFVLGGHADFVREAREIKNESVEYLRSLYKGVAAEIRSPFLRRRWRRFAAGSVREMERSAEEMIAERKEESAALEEALRSAQSAGGLMEEDVLLRIPVPLLLLRVWGALRGFGFGLRGWGVEEGEGRGVFKWGKVVVRLRRNLVWTIFLNALVLGVRIFSSSEALRQQRRDADRRDSFFPPFPLL
uniref:Uncharacterized protein n=1 Tax=Chromera velia CCMP2878 TaxID=1169474 RepID=A0A0G4HD39_9ALVE|eukprot:Cvel_26432.t1-p1 / transcript=Cvel_26432.t1 / gene=Cvel_26432 / organism=Chromera_velia_CCMP2878 / gene_product=hypothetical protein / transcript_product=hypothetical protein / location=Cvel_scaffold3139:6065-10127(-) / protein_length=391 / sequence_SO=supercontig / SO=protein_coding / is_pseudo=false